MKVLAILNVSNMDDISCDSGVIFQRIISRYFIKKGVQYHIIVPDRAQFRSYFFDNSVILHFVPASEGRYACRFHFDWILMHELISTVCPDIIFNNQVELTSAIRSVLISIKTNIKLITYCHYPALYETNKSDGIPVLDSSLNHNNVGTAILFDILSALLTSDNFIIQSEFAKQLIQTAANFYKINYKEILVVPPPVDNELLEYVAEDTPNSRIVLFNHRLYESYGIDDFLNLMRDCAHLDFKLVVSDPMPNRSIQRINHNKTPLLYREQIASLPFAKIVNGNINRQEYAKLITKSRVAFAAPRKACVWSMSALDCMSLGVPVIAPKYAAYTEFIPAELTYDNTFSAKIILEKLLNDNNYWKQMSNIVKNSAKNYYPDVICNELYNIFYKLISSRH